MNLNSEQAECVAHPADVLQILAGPGSGKTRVLTVRVALAAKKTPPKSIVVLTFTNKAARELRERLHALDTNGVVIGTFHSVALRYLQRYGKHIGLGKIEVADTSESKSVLTKILKGRDTQMTATSALSSISKLKMSNITLEMFQKPKMTDAQQELLELYRAYQEYLQKRNLLDFDDLIIHAISLFKVYPQLGKGIQQVFVDEFQDTSAQQFELMTLLASNRRLSVVGDHDQSIYGFRAADIKNFESLRRVFPECVTFQLRQNYRSTGAIVFAALALIEQDNTRPAKDLQTENVLGHQPVLRCLKSAKLEAEWLAGEITRLIATGLRYEDVAVLVRSASLTLPVEQALQRRRIKYRLANAKKFLERPHIRTLVGYLKVVEDESSLALLEVVNVPPRKFGQVSCDKLAQSGNMWQALKSFKRSESLSRMIHCIERARKSKDAPVQTILTTIISGIDYFKYIKTLENHEEKLADIQEFITTSDLLAEDEPDLMEVDLEHTDVQQTPLQRLLSALSLMSDSDESKPGVTISTIHSAKGLEWPVVFIPGVYEGSIPSSRAEEHDEERRLLYVAMTRAKALLYLSYPEKSARQEDVFLSSFITSKMRPFLADAGPMLTTHVVREISTLLNTTLVATNTSDEDVSIQPDFSSARTMVEIPVNIPKRSIKSFFIEKDPKKIVVQKPIQPVLVVHPTHTVPSIIDGPVRKKRLGMGSLRTRKT